MDHGVALVDERMLDVADDDAGTRGGDPAQPLADRVVDHAEEFASLHRRAERGLQEREPAPPGPHPGAASALDRRRARPAVVRIDHRQFGEHVADAADADVDGAESKRQASPPS